MDKRFDRRVYEAGMAKRDAHLSAVDANRHRMNVLLAILLGVFAAGVFLGAVAGRSPMGFVAGVIAAGSPWAWMRGDRARVEEIGPEHRPAYARELGWSLLAVILLVGGYAWLIMALVHGW